jgi:hypothetical protein
MAGSEKTRGAAGGGHRKRVGARSAVARPATFARGIGVRGGRLTASRVAALLTGATCLAGVTVEAPAAVYAARPAARAAHTLSVRDEGHLHLAGKPSGSLIVEEGVATGTLPGTVRVRFDVGATITAQFTIYARGGGSISGHGSGTLHSTSLYSTFGGSLSVTSGTGRFAHARGKGGMYGAINRKTDALTVQTIGNLTY